MKIALPVLALMLAATVHAADAPRKYGILSLAGDSFSTITYVPEIGSRIDINDKQVYSLGDNTVFDEAAIRAASAALQQVQPEAGRFLMLSTDAELHQQQNAMFDDPAANQANREFLKSLWKDLSTRATQGVLMPFAYVKLRLINADTLAVEGEVRLKQSELVTYSQEAGERAVRTWGALSAKEKTAYLDRLLREAVSQGVPRLLKQ